MSMTYLKGAGACSKTTFSGEATPGFNGGGIIWFTGLSGAGKSTLSKGVAKVLEGHGLDVLTLDGDDFRKQFCSDLGYSVRDRNTNVRRAAQIAKHFFARGRVVICSFISPVEQEREKVRKLFPRGNYVEVFCSSPLSVCEARDVKGLYKKARLGLINNFTGITAPYEVPAAPDVVVNTSMHSEAYCVDKIIGKIHELNTPSSGEIPGF